MKKIVISLVLSVFVLAGSGLMLMATENKNGEKAKTCCSATADAAKSTEVVTVAKTNTEATAKAEKAESCCSGDAEKSKTAEKAEGECCGGTNTSSDDCCGKCDDETASASKSSECAEAAGTVKSACAETATAATAGCGDASAVKTAQQTESIPGECVKLPAGINTSAQKK